MFNFKKTKKKDFVHVIADRVLELGDQTISNLELIRDNRKQINKLLENDIEINKIVQKQQDEILELSKCIKKLQKLVDQNIEES